MPEHEHSNETLPRDTWARKSDFLIALIGFSVGLGNVWRFPYLCYKHGGGAFLFPYFLCVFLAGIPMLYLEVVIGQFMSCGGIGAWRICPLLQGVGMASLVIVTFLNTYYNVILTWAFYYLFSSFTSVLPWSHCNNEWNTVNCTESFNKTGGNSDPVEEFWTNKVLDLSNGIDEFGTIKWDLALTLLLVWIVVYFCIWNGIHSSGKVLWITATSPYILLVVLLIRGLTLPGATEGLKFYLSPNITRLGDTEVWVDASAQVFFSYSISLGALTALGSYNKFNHNCWRDSLVYVCTNTFTSFLAGMVIFSILGFMSQEQGIPIDDVAESGPGLAFIAYPKAVTLLPIPPLWSSLFFMMIILLGLDSQFVGVEGFVTAIVDEFPHYLGTLCKRRIFIAIVCSYTFLFGLTMVTNGGYYIFQVIDNYSGSRIILGVACFECLAISLYGVNKFYDNIEAMLGFRHGRYLKISWQFITPAFSFTMLLMALVEYENLTYNDYRIGKKYLFPVWSIVFGWCTGLLAIIAIPITAAYKLSKAKGTLKERFEFMLIPQWDSKPSDSTVTQKESFEEPEEAEAQEEDDE